MATAFNISDSLRKFVIAFLVAGLCFMSVGCSDASAEDSTDGPSFEMPAKVQKSGYSSKSASGANGAHIDTSSVDKGYVSASATSSSRLKFQVTCGDMSYNYDLPNNGDPIVCPINMGDGSYTFSVLQNTSGNNYVVLYSTNANVKLDSEFAPYLVPTIFCNFSEDSASTAQARQLAQNAQNEGDVVRAVYQWMVDNITYDNDKASKLATASGYVPNPDETLETKTGICFDYAALGAAMLRSLGIPTKVITGYVAPDNIYHAWNMIYIDGSWQSVEISISPNNWTRVDFTFAASGAGDTIGNGTEYTDRYVY